VARDLSALTEAFRSHDGLRRVLSGASVPAAARVGIVRALADRLDVSGPVAKLVVLLADRGRLELLDDIASVYAERLLAHKNIVPAQVVSAVPLTPEKIAAFEASLAKVTGRTVQLQVDIDPTLIGGVVARIGSTVYDGSIRTQLQKMKQQLVQRA
jgi:F-type H+-transporting ATPase subunit delta